MGLHQLLPASLLAGRWIVVLVCYLDDSGGDPQNVVETLAGYIASEDQWKAFEQEVEQWFTEFNVDVMHASDMHKTDGEFKDWTVLRKQAFVARLCQTMNHHIMMGFSFSVRKNTYKQEREERAKSKKRTITPCAFCFNTIIDWIMRDIRIGKAVNTEGVALVLETGHRNNSEAELRFNEVRKYFKLENILRSISFVPKSFCRAIQMADLVAFYSRRDAIKLEKAVREGHGIYEVDTMAKIIVDANGIPYRSAVALDFGQAAEGHPYWRQPS